MKRLGVLIAIVMVASVVPAAAKGGPSLSQGCFYVGRVETDIRKGKDATSDANKADPIFLASPDPQAQAAHKAELQFVLEHAGAESLLSQPGPLTIYCQANYPAAYFKGSRVVSPGCAQQVASWVALRRNASNTQEKAAESTMMTACGSKAEWLQAATHAIPEGNSSFGKPTDIYKAICDPKQAGGAGPANAATPGCRNK